MKPLVTFQVFKDDVKSTLFTNDPISALERIKANKNRFSGSSSSSKQEEEPSKPVGFATFPGFFGSGSSSSSDPTKSSFRNDDEDEPSSRPSYQRRGQSGSRDSNVRVPDFFKNDGYDPFEEISAE